MKIPQISIILPVYNTSQYILKAVNSILQQSLTDFELILIDDGSSDGTEQLVRQLADKDSRIRLVQRSNKGLITTLNEGVALARSPLIARMDADDIAFPERLAVQYAYMNSHPDLLAVGSYVIFMDDQDTMYRKKTFPRGKEILEAFRWGCPLVHPAIMMRTNAVREVGGYPSAFPSAEDYALWVRLLSLGNVDTIPQVLLAYRVHGCSISHAHARQQRDSILRAQCIWLSKQEWTDDICQLPAENLQSFLSPTEQRELLARMLALNPHIIGTSPEQDPEAQKWLPRILQGPITPEIRKALALYHLRAARAPGLSTSARLYHLCRCTCYSPHEFIEKMGEFLRGRLQCR